MSYTHDKVRKTYVHLKRAIPNMFKFIGRPEVPKKYKCPGIVLRSSERQSQNT